MKRYITVDGGTTNTRIHLVEDGEVTFSSKAAIGWNDKTSASFRFEKLRMGISELLLKNRLTEKDIERVIVSGMISSEFGIYNLAHTLAPVGFSELKANSVEVNISDISSIPFVVVSGVKTSADTFENFNIMRGEETETMGLVDSMGGNCIYVLPGSHTKILRVSSDNKIVDFRSAMTGEMIAALSEKTILSDSVDLSVGEIQHDALAVGYEYCKKVGMNEALLKARVLKNIFNKDKVYIYSFFMGILLCNDIGLIHEYPEKRVLIGGRKEIKKAIATLLNKFSNKEVIELDEKTVAESTARGAVRIYEFTSETSNN